MNSSINSSLEISLHSLDALNITFENDVSQVVNEKCETVKNYDEKKKIFVDKIINAYLRHNLTLVCLEDFMELMNDNREPCDQFPTNKKQILKLFKEHRDLFDVFFFVKCDKCNITTKTISESPSANCSRCDKILKTAETNFFAVIPIEQQIKKSVEENWYYISKFETSGSEDSSYSDAHDGKILRELLQKYKDSDINILSLCLNIDGANKYNSNDLSVWPIQLMQNYLPPNIRFLPKNIIVNGLYYHKDKPNCHEYLLPLIDELNQLNDQNITMSIDGESYIFKPVITSCSVDLPAKSILQATKQFGSYDGCTYCDIPGELIVIENSYDSDDEDSKKKKQQKKKKKSANTNNKAIVNMVNTQKKFTQFVRYVEGEEEPKLRDEVETLKTMLRVAASMSKEAVDGIKDVSCLVGLKHFNIIFSIGVDYMHACLLGAVKRMLNFFCNSKYKAKSYYIRPKNRIILNKRLLAIRPTSNITRKPRSLDQKKNFKASEYRSLLLFYLPVCLPGLVPNEYVQHLRLLSASVYTLLKAKIYTKEVDEAEITLHKFVKQHQHLFGKENMVMVIHLLKHLSDSVRNLGPLWCHSAFPFERNNGSLLKLVNGTTDIIHQVSSKFTLYKSLPTNTEVTVNETIYRGKSFDITEKSLKVVNVDTLENLDFSNVPLIVYKRIQLDKIMYTSLMYTRPNKSIDYFIGLKNEAGIGMARFYFDYKDKTHVVIEEFEVIENIYHIDRVIKTNRNILAPIDNIEKKYIFMKIGLNQYVVTPPNPYENE